MEKRKAHRGGTEVRKWPLPMLDWVSGTKQDRRTPSGLYALCMDLETKLEELDIGELQSSLTEFFIFQPRLFIANPSGDSDPSNERRYDGYPFSFSILGPDSEVSKPDWRYQQLLRLLKQFDDVELRWLLLARWLYEESICKPDEFLPPEMLQRLVQRYIQRHGKFSRKDRIVWNLVSVWRLYFSALAKDASAIAKKNRRRQELEKLGYDSDAIDFTLYTRSLTRAITSWLEGRDKGNARSLENAYSRGQSFLRKLPPDL
jgi:hypothetical protein